MRPSLTCPHYQLFVRMSGAFQGIFKYSSSLCSKVWEGVGGEGGGFGAESN